MEGFSAERVERFAVGRTTEQLLNAMKQAAEWIAERGTSPEVETVKTVVAAELESRGVPVPCCCPTCGALK